MALASCPAPGQQRSHSGGADHGSANKRVSLTNAQAPGHAARLGARQPGRLRTDHLFLRCPEQHRRTLELAPERRPGARLAADLASLRPGHSPTHDRPDCMSMQRRPRDERPVAARSVPLLSQGAASRGLGGMPDGLVTRGSR